MAVFTEVSPKEVAGLLAQYNIGEFVSMKGITSGIENTNYYVSTDRGCFVLTIFERLTAQELPFYLQLCRHLGNKGLPVSAPEVNRNEGLLSFIKDKPCAIAECLPGQSVEIASADLCAQLGTVLAQMHLGTVDFPLLQKNTKGLQFWISSLPLLKPHMSENNYQLLEDEVEHQKKLFETVYPNLERGAVHADLFRNNALVEEAGGSQKLGGIIDFYFACTAPYIYDLAVTVNDWCIDLATGEFIPEKVHALLNAYNKVRPLSDIEKDCWQDSLRAAACRFWVSRLYDFYLPREASLLKPHDPTHFERILRLRKAMDPESLPWVQ